MSASKQFDGQSWVDRGWPTVRGVGPAAGRPIPRVEISRGRRLVDLLIAGSVLLVTAPILALTALAVVLESRGGALFRQRRVGLRGQQFEVIKLRTMVQGAERQGTGLVVVEGDSRITRVGAFLRRTSIDELPNLINVLRGEMSIIGPRPTVASQVEQYTDHQLGRLAIPPGITGLAQVSGRASLPWPDRIELDLRYIERRSPRLDWQILMRTAGSVFGGADLYSGDRGGWRG